MVRKHRLDLLHVHAGSGGVFLLRKPSCPLVVTAHHTYLQEAELVFRDRPIKRFWKTIMSRLERRTYILADFVTCVSRDTADFLVQRYGVPVNKVHVIENAIAHDSLLPIIPKSDHTILFIGRVEERKGVRILLDAMTFVRNALPNARLRFLGENCMGDEFLSLISAKKLTDVVTISGYVYEPLLRRELVHATVLVVPSLLEGFGLVAAQGMIASTCVVASDAPGLRSIVKDRQNGLLFKSGDSVDLARAIIEVLRDSALREKLQKEGREDALKRFSPEERARDLHNVFLKSLARHN